MAAEITAAGGAALALPTDVTDLAAVEAMVAATRGRMGPARRGRHQRRHLPGHGVARLIFDSVPQDWADTIAVNLTGAYYCVRAAVPHMRQAGGHIILIGSGKGHRAMPDDSAYACSKAGAWMLVRTMAEELAQERICVNELIPGPVDTPMNPLGAGQPSAAEWHKQPEDVMPLALFLATQPLTGPTGQSFSLMRRDSQ